MSIRRSDRRSGRPLPVSEDLTAAPAIDASQILDQLGDAVVVADARGVIRFVNHATGEMFGWSAGELVGSSLTALVPSRFRAAHASGFSRFVATGSGRLVGGPAIEVAALRRDGSEIAVELSLRSIDSAGSTGRMVVATIRDIRDRLILERLALVSRTLQASVEGCRDGVLAVSADRKVLAVNRRFCELWRMPPGFIRPGDDSPALMNESQSQIVDPDAFEAAILWGHRHPNDDQTLEVPLKDGRVLQGYATPLFDDEKGYLGRVWYLHDATERRAIEAERQQLSERLALALRSREFLLEASSVLSRVSGFAETLRSLAAVAVPTLGDLCLIDVVDETGAIRRMAAVHADPSRQALTDRLYRYPPDPQGEHPSVRAIRESASYSSPELTKEYLRITSRNDEHLSLLEALSFDSYMTVPLVFESKALGAVTLVSAGSGRRFGPSDLALAEDLAVRVAGVVAKEYRFEGQRSLSHTLQTSLLPSEVPRLPAGYEMAVRYLPGTLDAEVGGDFWDVSVLPDGDLALALGDVAGHDIRAAATMAQLRSACRALRPHADSPAALIDLVQRNWDQLGLDLIATAVFARVKIRTGKLQMASAGHPPPLVVRAGSARFAPVVPSGPLGSPGGKATLWEEAWTPGTALVFYTDGLVEDRLRDLSGGMELLRHAAAASPSLDPTTLADYILSELSGTEREDDVALLVVYRTPDSSR